MNYRREIDGLRAIAVLSVLLYHAQFIIFGRDWFQGGFVGVDIFFVISGYLITSIIIQELRQNNSINIIGFFERRARRILPMLLLVIGTTIPIAWHFLLPGDLINFSKSTISAVAFYSNFFFFSQSTQYGAEAALTIPLLHTWSLGVEEQFYIIAPFLMLICWRFAKQYFLTILLSMSLVSLQLAQYLSQADYFGFSEFNFFLPLSRFWELLVGSLLAYVKTHGKLLKNNFTSHALPIIGLFLVMHSIAFFDASTPHPSFKTLIPISGVSLIILFCSSSDLIGKILSTRIFVGIGLISYSLYLWHFPILAFGRRAMFDPSNETKLFWVAIAFFLSILSFFFIEKPARNRNLVGLKLFVTTSIASVLTISIISVNFIVNDGYPNRVPPILSLIEDAQKDEPFTQNGAACYNRTSGFCSADYENSPVEVFAIGDSHFATLTLPLLNKLKNRLSYKEANLAGCPFVLNVDQLIDGAKSDVCNATFQNVRLNHITNNSIVIIGGRFPLYLNKTPFDNKEGGVEKERLYEFIGTNGLNFSTNFVNTVEEILNRGAQIILIYPIPEAGFHVPRQVYKQVRGKNVNRVNDYFIPVTTSYDVYRQRAEQTFELFNKLKSPSIQRIFPHTLFCDTEIKGRCITHDAENLFYIDDDHPSTKGAEMIVDLIVNKITALETRTQPKATQ